MASRLRVGMINNWPKISVNNHATCVAIQANVLVFKKRGFLLSSIIKMSLIPVNEVNTGASFGGF